MCAVLIVTNCQFLKAFWWVAPVWKVWRLMVLSTRTWMTWPPQAVCKAWRWVMPSARIWRAWPFQAVCKAWWLVTSLVRTWRGWSFQAVCRLSRVRVCGWAAGDLYSLQRLDDKGRNTQEQCLRLDTHGQAFVVWLLGQLLANSRSASLTKFYVGAPNDVPTAAGK